MHLRLTRALFCSAVIAVVGHGDFLHALTSAWLTNCEVLRVGFDATNLAFTRAERMFRLPELAVTS